MVRLHDSRDLVGQMAMRARQVVLDHCEPNIVRAQMEALYLSRPSPAPAPPRSRVSRRPRVSAVVPVFNQSSYLSETVRSIRDSLWDDIEVVIVNDGSTNPQVAHDLTTLDDVVLVEHPRNRGLAAARNSGIAASSGDLIIPIDADDLIHPTYIPKAVDALRRNPELSYVGCYSRNFGLLDTTYVPVGFVPSLMLFLHTDGRCTKLFHRRALESVGGYDEDLPAFEDWDLYLCLAEQGHVGDVLPEALFFYRRHEQSMVFTWSNERRIELLQFLVHKHLDLLDGRSEVVVLQLLHLWKTYFEVSESVLLQQRRARP